MIFIFFRVGPPEDLDVELDPDQCSSREQRPFPLINKTVLRIISKLLLDLKLKKFGEKIPRGGKVILMWRV
jgi:hypothetical protein